MSWQPDSLRAALSPTSTDPTSPLSARGTPRSQGAALTLATSVASAWERPVSGHELAARPTPPGGVVNEAYVVELEENLLSSEREVKIADARRRELAAQNRMLGRQHK